MQTNGEEIEAFQAKPAAQYDLKSLPLQDLEKKLESSPVGLSQAEAAKWLADIVLADARSLEGDPSEVDQSALTGESFGCPRARRK